MQMQGQVALVTGAASGIGAATARLLAQNGAAVVLADIDVVGGATHAGELASEGLRAEFIRSDVGDEEDVQAMVGRCVDAFGSLSLAVNCAAVNMDQRPVADLDLEAFDRTMRVGVRGLALCMKYELAAIIERGQGGSVVNISSIRGLQARANSPAYTAAKHAAIGLTRAAAIENGPAGVRVNAVAPGVIETPMFEAGLAASGRNRSEYAREVSVLGRFGTADEVAQACLWLCSPASSYVTGTTISVDGGFGA